MFYQPNTKISSLVNWMSEKIIFEIEIIREEWNNYQLSDGTDYRTKFILTHFDATPKSNKLHTHFNRQILQKAWNVDKSLYGVPDKKKHSAAELTLNIQEPDLDFELIEAGESEYLLKSKNLVGEFKGTSEITSISRSSLKNKTGKPEYVTQISVKFQFKALKQD